MEKNLRHFKKINLSEKHREIWKIFEGNIKKFDICLWEIKIEGKFKENLTKIYEIFEVNMRKFEANTGKYKKN